MGGNGRSVEEIASGLSSYMDSPEIKSAIKDLRNTGEKAAVNHIRQFLKHKDASIRYMAKKAMEDLSKGVSSSVESDNHPAPRKAGSASRGPGIISKIVSFTVVVVKWTVVIGIIVSLSYGGYVYRDRIIPVFRDIYAALARYKDRAGRAGSTEAAGQGSTASTGQGSAVFTGEVSASSPAQTPDVAADSVGNSSAAVAIAASTEGKQAEPSGITSVAGEVVPAEVISRIAEFYASLSSSYNEKAIDKFMDHFDLSGIFKTGNDGSVYEMAAYRTATELEFSAAPEVTMKVEVMEIRKVSDEEFGARVSAVYKGTFEGSTLDQRFMSIKRTDTVTKRQGAWKLAAVSF